MTKKIKWNLKEAPTSEGLEKLVKAKILKEDEAREILFSYVEEEKRDIDSLKSEIEFLRKLVQKLSERSQIVSTIREIEVPYYKKYPWYGQYEVWCGGTVNNISTQNHANNSISFSGIKTF